MEEKKSWVRLKILPQIQDWLVSEKFVVGWRENERNNVGSNLILYGKVFCVVGNTEDSWARFSSRTPPSGLVKEALTELSELGQKWDPGLVRRALVRHASAWPSHGSDGHTSQSTRGV